MMARPVRRPPLVASEPYFRRLQLSRTGARLNGEAPKPKGRTAPGSATRACEARRAPPDVGLKKKIAVLKLESGEALEKAANRDFRGVESELRLGRRTEPFRINAGKRRRHLRRQNRKPVPESRRCAHWEAGVGTPRLARYFTRSRSFRPTPGGHLDCVMRTKKASHTAYDAAGAVVGTAARLGARDLASACDRQGRSARRRYLHTGPRCGRSPTRDRHRQELRRPGGHRHRNTRLLRELREVCPTATTQPLTY